jgi:starch phosphorylase
VGVRASREFDLKVFNEGGYVEAVREKGDRRDDHQGAVPERRLRSGKELRLVQQYFFVACSLKDIIRRYRKKNRGWEAFADKVAIQLNDTHPAIAVPELMRILLDEEGLSWDLAWALCTRVFSYTNHTLMPEALEKWSVPLLEKGPAPPPRDSSSRSTAASSTRWSTGAGRATSASAPSSRWSRRDPEVRADGVPVRHREPHRERRRRAPHQLLKTRLFKTFHELYPERFQNKTNGITPRRWLKQCNPRLSALIDETIGDGWPVDLDQLRQLESHAEDPEFQRRFMAVKLANKRDLAEVIRHHCNVSVDPTAIFDVQIQAPARVQAPAPEPAPHPDALSTHPARPRAPDAQARLRLRRQGGAGYDLAKRIIHAINAVAAKVNSDPRVKICSRWCSCPITR